MKSLDNLFENYIQDKKVAIVGPAAYMEKMNLGTEIDSADVVIRINRSYESIDKFSQNIGSRTDILYSCLIEKPANAGVLDLLEFKRRGIHFICAPPESNMKGLSTTTKFHNMVNVKKVNDISKEIPVRIVDHAFHNSLALEVDCRPNTGFMAIYDILRFGPSKLHIYGFSFYLDGFVTGVKEGIEQEQNKTQAEFATQCFNSKRHVQKNMWQFAKSTLLKNKIVELDDTLFDILNLSSLDRTLFASRQKI